MTPADLHRHYINALSDSKRWSDEAPWLAALRSNDAAWLRKELDDRLTEVWEVEPACR